MTDVSIGAIGAAITGAGVSLLSLVISKESKTSEFRQTWINELRSDVAEAISAVSLLNTFFAADGHHDLPPEFLEAWSRATAALARIELRLNITEDDHAIMAGMIRRTETMLRDGAEGKSDHSMAEQLQEEVVELTQRILKKEWDRVREGEATFVIAKWMTLAVVLYGGAKLMLVG